MVRASRPCGDAVDELVKHGHGSPGPLAWLNDVMSDPVVVRRGPQRRYGTTAPSGCCGPTGPGPWLSRSLVDAGRPAPAAGSDAAEAVLAELGRAADLDRLVADAVIRVPANSGLTSSNRSTRRRAGNASIEIPDHRQGARTRPAPPR